MCALPILTLPVELSITSGFNAIAHAAEALYAPNGNPLIDGLAEQGITAMCRALPLLRRQPVDASARSDALYGAWAFGMCLGATDMGLHHKLCHTLGGAFALRSEARRVGTEWVIKGRTRLSP